MTTVNSKFSTSYGNYTGIVDDVLKNNCNPLFTTLKMKSIHFRDLINILFRFTNVPRNAFIDFMIPLSMEHLNEFCFRLSTRQKYQTKAKPIIRLTPTNLFLKVLQRVFIKRVTNHLRWSDI